MRKRREKRTERIEKESDKEKLSESKSEIARARERKSRRHCPDSTHWCGMGVEERSDIYY